MYVTQGRVATQGLPKNEEFVLRLAPRGAQNDFPKQIDTLKSDSAERVARAVDILQGANLSTKHFG